MTNHWPQFPYRPFTPFGLEDAALFAGRDADVRNCMQAFGNGLTKMLIIHGQAGVGKSSLMQAGLCPHFKQNGYLFPEDDHKLLVASMEHYPLEAVCRTVFKLCTTTPRTTAPDGHPDEHPAFAINDFSSVTDFAHAANADPTLLGRWLAAKARQSSKTLVLLIDHVEALFDATVTDEHRRSVLDAIKFILTTPMDLKCVLSIRSDRVGDLQDALRTASHHASVRWYLLKPMSRDALQQLVLSPSRMRRHHGVSAIEKYAVFFDPGLPSTIAEDIDKSVPVSEAMATGQLICALLYSLAIGSKQFEVVAAVENQAYKTLGPAYGSIERYILHQLRTMAREISIKPDEEDNFVSGWIHVMAEMAKPGLDGLIKNRALRAEEVELLARKNCVDADIDRALEWLQGNTHRLIGMHKPVVGCSPGTEGTPITLYSLSHSSLARPITSLCERARDVGQKHAPLTASEERGLGSANRTFTVYGGIIGTLIAGLVVSDAVRWWMLVAGLLTAIAMVMWIMSERQKTKEAVASLAQARRRRLAIALSPRTWARAFSGRGNDPLLRPIRGLSYSTEYVFGDEEEAQSKLNDLAMEPDGRNA